MPSIISYRKHIDALRTVELRCSDGLDCHPVGTELATLGGVTYVSIPDSYVLPEQAPEIAQSVCVVTLSETLRQDVGNASPHVALIRQRVQEKIGELYSMADEIKLLRTAPSPEFEVYNAYVEECRQWGRDRRADLGL